MSGLTEPSSLTSNRNDLDGVLFRGRVEVADDPKRLGRVRVSVPAILEADNVEQLPWAIPLTMGQGAAVGDITLDVPAVGTAVYVMFQQGNLHYPIYYGAAHIEDLLPTLLTTNYPSRVGRRFADGTYLMYDRSNGFTELHHKSGTLVRVTGSGNLTASVAGDTELTATGNTSIEASGSVSITAGSELTINTSSDISITSAATVTISATQINLN